MPRGEHSQWLTLRRRSRQVRQALKIPAMGNQSKGFIQQRRENIPRNVPNLRRRCDKKVTQTRRAGKLKLLLVDGFVFKRQQCTSSPPT